MNMAHKATSSAPSEKGKNEVKEFSFNELYAENSHQLLQNFMSYLEVPAIGEESANGENE